MKFSIGIPAYKATFLKECIDSILNQTFLDYELIIVNDASPEDIDSIVNSYSDSRIRYFKNAKNFGAENLVDNWNKCLTFALGEYFILMGDDDMMCSDYLEEFNRLINKHPKLSVYHCRSMIIDENSNFITLTETRPEFESVYENIWHCITEKRVQFISDFVYQRKLLVKNGGFYKIPLAWASDDISAYIASMGNGIANTNKPVFNYRKNAQTISSSGNFEFKLQAIKEEQFWLKSFLNKITPSNKVDRHLHQMISTHLNNYATKKKVYTLSSNLKQIKLSRIGYWYSILRQYNISIPVFVYAVIIRIKDKRKLKAS